MHLAHVLTMYQFNTDFDGKRAKSQRQVRCAKTPINRIRKYRKKSGAYAQFERCSPAMSA